MHAYSFMVGGAIGMIIAALAMKHHHGMMYALYTKKKFANDSGWQLKFGGNADAGVVPSNPTPHQLLCIANMLGCAGVGNIPGGFVFKPKAEDPVDAGDDDSSFVFLRKTIFPKKLYLA